MRFKLTLDESLFDDELDNNPAQKIDEAPFDDIDDSYGPYEMDHDVEDVLPGPQTDVDSGVASVFISLINDEWEAIEGYNSTIATLRSEQGQNPFYADAIKVLEEISAEENRHVGQLQELLKRISPNAKEIGEGEKEAKSQLGLVGGKLMVQSWETPTTNTTPNDVDEMCTLCDVDDDM